MQAEDTQATCRCLQSLGLDIEQRGQEMLIKSPGINDLEEPEMVLDCGNSGTTMRLLAGLLAGRPFTAILSGDSSLNKRPMGRVMKPLAMMGAHFMARQDSFPH